MVKEIKISLRKEKCATILLEMNTCTVHCKVLEYPVSSKRLY